MGKITMSKKRKICFAAISLLSMVCLSVFLLFIGDYEDYVFGVSLMMLLTVASVHCFEGKILGWYRAFRILVTVGGLCCIALYFLILIFVPHQLGVMKIYISLAMVIPVILLNIPYEYFCRIVKQDKLRDKSRR